MELAPDFFSYFEATAPLLDADENLLCVSSWNDHGLVRTVCVCVCVYRRSGLLLTWQPSPTQQSVKSFINK